MSTSAQDEPTLSKDYIFVLWGDGFDEAVATIFVTELREAGLLVRVVGLTPRKISGARGLALVPDLTLDQALPLASQAICLIVPSTSRWSERYNSDPRLHEFFRQANSNQAKFVIGSFNEIIPTSRELLTLTSENVMVYPEIENIVKFARKTAKFLSSVD